MLNKWYHILIMLLKLAHEIPFSSQVLWSIASHLWRSSTGAMPLWGLPWPHDWLRQWLPPFWALCPLGWAALELWAMRITPLMDWIQVLTSLGSMCDYLLREKTTHCPISIKTLQKLISLQHRGKAFHFSKFHIPFIFLIFHIKLMIICSSLIL